MRQNEYCQPETTAETSASELSEAFYEVNGTIYKVNKRYLLIGVTDGALYQSDEADFPDDEWEKCEEHGKR